MITCAVSLLVLNTSIVEASEFNFAVTPTTPKSQIDKEKTYFDLKLEPNQEEILNVTLRNDTDKEVKVEISVNSATTNSNVVVEYGKNDIEKDESLDIDVEEYVDYPETVTLKPESEQVVPFKVKMPNEKFIGVLAGGITFKEVTEDTSPAKDNEKGLSIENEYSYVVALLMRQNLNEIDPNLLLKDVGPGQINARNVILAGLQNDQKTYINQVAIKAEITKKGSSKVLYSEDKDGMQIAPNSSFTFPVSLNGSRLEAGEYHLSMTVFGNKSEDGQFIQQKGATTINFKNQWKLEKDFKIDGNTAKTLNAKDVTIKKDNTWIYLLIGILLILLVLILIIWLVWRKKKNDEEEKKAEERKNKSKNKKRKRDKKKV
ncbi:DUF916 and DUF3324 domain-containing protein [Enterococcus ureasiticus]|nr:MULTISPECIES: DUF916 and DUF3324 domain-containing protein [Enterococcus]MBO0433156.1 DUF916 and DUF3324 domain-containing protein [Enterococcus sp. DIV0849a]MBO0473887.1 DUF916 and DUF3324 domain-containing protein [Enterococcus ureasiticus]